MQLILTKRIPPLLPSPFSGCSCECFALNLLLKMFVILLFEQKHNKALLFSEVKYIHMTEVAY